MANIESQFNDDITATMDDAFGDLFRSEDSTEFTAQLTIFRSEPMPDYPGNASEAVAELRWQATAFAAPSAEYKFEQLTSMGATLATPLFWRMKEAPEQDGGEVIATVYQTKRSKTGAV